MANSFRFRNPSARGYSVIAADDAASTITFTLPAVTSEITISDSATGVTNIASGNTAQRPSNPVAGMIRFNTTTSSLEVYNSNTSSWTGL